MKDFKVSQYSDAPQSEGAERRALLPAPSPAMFPLYTSPHQESSSPVLNVNTDRENSQETQRVLGVKWSSVNPWPRAAIWFSVCSSGKPGHAHTGLLGHR